MIAAVKNMHFRLRRISLLLTLRGKLTEKKFQEDRTAKVLMMISDFCRLESIVIQELIAKHSNSFLTNYKSDELTKLVEEIYLVDSKDFEEYTKSIIFAWKEIAFSDQEKDLYDLLKGKSIGNPK